MLKLLKSLMQDEAGQTLAEYAVLIGLITVAVVAVITPFRQAIINKFTATTNALNTP